MNSRPTIYLAGSIRDGHPEDVAWRENFIDLVGYNATILNPLGAKKFEPESGIWTMSGIIAEAKHIVKQDFWCVDRADIVVANLLSLAEGYPSIGTVMEMGRATYTNTLIYAIVAAGYAGHENKGVFNVHPFLDQCIAQAFPTVKSCFDFVVPHLQMLSGDQPRFDPPEKEAFFGGRGL